MIKLYKHQDKEYQLYNGLVFDKGTDERVMEIISENLNTNERIRIFEGNTNDGIDWCEIYDTIGYIGSTYPSSAICNGRFPLLISNKRSTGGDAINCARILKITKNKKTIYKHPNYQCNLEVKKINDNEFGIFRQNDKIIMLKYQSQKAAESVMDFLLGKRNNYVTK